VRLQIALDWVPGSPRIAFDHLGAGPLVVFLHGIGGNRTNWTAQLRAVADDFHAVAWDARGYGESDDYEGPLAFSDFSDDLARLLDHLGASRAHLVGLSMGGRIALDFYERQAERVASLVLCDSFPGFDAQSFTREQREAFVRSRKDPLLAGKSPREMAPPVAKNLVSPSAAPEVVALLIESMAALHVDSYIKTIEATTHYERVAALTQVSVPVQLIVGEDDKLTPPALSKSMADALPDAELEIIEGAGHLSNLERPATFNAALRRFLERVRDRD
jgi:3-oxoadipate enol-lactonase